MRAPAGCSSSTTRPRNGTASAAAATAMILLLFAAWAGAAAAAQASAAASARWPRSGDEKSCARPPIVLIPGLMGSDLDVKLLGSSSLGAAMPCSGRKTHYNLWPPMSPDLLVGSSGLSCFKWLIQPVPCGSLSGSGIDDGAGGQGKGALCNRPGVSISVSDGGRSGMDGLSFKQGGYDKLVDWLEREFGYRAGRDLFALPYDWRLSVGALDRSGGFDRMAARVAEIVKLNCGNKALLLSHSMGGLVTLGLLQNERFKEWREANVASWLSLAPPFGGSTYAVASKLGGNRVNLLDLLGSVLQPVLNEMVYQGSRGLPSVLMLMPYASMWGAEYTLVSTPTKNYTLQHLPELFEAIGDTQAAEMFAGSHDFMDAVLQRGPVQGVNTFCIYGAAAPTVKSWRYRAPFVRGRPAPAGSAEGAVVGLGDGVVNVESMRLCHKLTDSAQVYELGAGVDHSNVLNHPASMAALRHVMAQVLVGYPAATAAPAPMRIG